MTASPLPRSLRVAGTTFAWVLGIGILLAIFALVWVGIRGAIAADFLRSAKGTASDVVGNIADPEAAAASIDKIASDTAAAHALTSDPIWRAVELTPWIGPQLHAVSTIAAAADDVAASALTPLADVASSLSADAFRPAGGRVELSGFIAVQDAAATSAEAMARATTALDSINDAALVAPLRTVVDEVTTTLDDTASATEALANASVLVPAMLGADGPRDYLVLFQNNAEWRSLGGIAGAMVQLHTDQGALGLATADAGNSFEKSPDSVVPLPEEVTAIYGERPGQWMQNVTQVPDFTLAATLAREQWRLKHGTEVDGVLAMDPVALSYILQATGPLTLPSGDVLTSQNAVSLLLNEVYLRYPDTAEQDAFFAQTTSAIFAALTAGPVDPGMLLSALSRAGDENRLLVWSSHPEEQAIVARTTLAGALPTTNADVSSFGVYLNDGTGSKMDFYQTADTSVLWESCTLDARGTASGTANLTVTVSNNAPADAASLPEYITAAGWYGVPAGSTRTVGYLYLPEGFKLTNATLSTGGGFGGGVHDGRRVLSFDVVLAPGESVSVSVAAASTIPTGSILEARITPGVNANVTRPISACL